MAVGLADRRRVSSLIEQEFLARRQGVKSEVTDDEVKAEVLAILKRTKLDKLVAKLAKLEADVAALRKQLSEKTVAMRKDLKVQVDRYRRNNCECHEDHETVLKDIATDAIKKRLNASAQLEGLRAQERKALAKVEIAQSKEDLTAIVKACGLV